MMTIGDTVLINGYKPSAIHGICVQRTIAGVHTLGGDIWYKVGIGANMYSTYPARRVKPVAKVVPPCTALMIRPTVALMAIA